MYLMRFFLAALSLAFSAGAAAEAAISLKGAWVRALPPSQPNTAAYLIIENTGTEEAEVVAAKAAGAERVEFHTTREVDGYVRMEQLTTLKVAAGQTLVLAPGGAHLMLLGLAAMPTSGDTVQLCLAFATGTEVCTDAPVRKGVSEDTHQHHHH